MHYFNYRGRTNSWTQCENESGLRTQIASQWFFFPLALLLYPHILLLPSTGISQRLQTCMHVMMSIHPISHEKSRKLCFSTCTVAHPTSYVWACPCSPCTLRRPQPNHLLCQRRTGANQKRAPKCLSDSIVFNSLHHSAVTVLPQCHTLLTLTHIFKNRAFLIQFACQLQM